jgi:hypothetical protein
MNAGERIPAELKRDPPPWKYHVDFTVSILVSILFIRYNPFSVCQTMVK